MNLDKGQFVVWKSYVDDLHIRSRNNSVHNPYNVHDRVIVDGLAIWSLGMCACIDMPGV